MNQNQNQSVIERLTRMEAYLLVKCFNEKGLGFALNILRNSDTLKEPIHFVSIVRNQLNMIAAIMYNCNEFHESKNNFITLANFLREIANFLEEGAKLV